MSPDERASGRTRLIGEIATLTFTVELSAGTGPQQPAPTFEANVMKSLAVELREEVEGKIRREVRKALGRTFDIDPIIVRPGSIELLVVISTLSAVVSNYTKFLQDLEAAVEGTRRIIRTVVTGLAGVGGPQVRVTGEWAGGRGLEREDLATSEAEEPARSVPDPRVSRILDQTRMAGVFVAYLLFSHLALIAILVYLLLQDRAA